MKTRIILLLALAAPVGSALAQAQVHSPPHPPRSHPPHSAPSAHPASHTSMDPVGTYDLDLDMHGQVTGAVLSITRDKDGKLKGTLDVHGQSIVLETVTVVESIVTLASGSELTVTLTFKNASELLGKWERSEQSGTLSGTRRKS
jgi:hypothetical protein